MSETDAEMQKRVDTADISVLIFSYSCANFLAVYVQTNCAKVYASMSYVICATSTMLLALCTSTVLLALCQKHCAMYIVLKRCVKSIVLKALCFKQCAYKHCNKSTVLKVAVSTVLKAMCYKQCAICTVLKAPCKKCCAIRTLLLLFWYVYANISATWFNPREFTLFWREFPNVAKYAFFVLIF